ncbi:MAG TPA: hypothetical protein VN687_08380 [Blastocatellia bacterium]|nr:hypothetical protein [Blastocatellia bacterium]
MTPFKREGNDVNWFLLVALLIAIAVIASQDWRRRQPRESTEELLFDATPDNDKVLIVKGWSEGELRKIIQDFVELYKEYPYPEYVIEIHNGDGALYRLTFPKDIHPRLFTFLVNYAAYPFDLPLGGRTILVAGRATLTSGYAGIADSHLGQQALFYLPENDEDHAVVYMQMESGVSFANDFSKLVWREVRDPRLSLDVKELIERSGAPGSPASNS